MMRIGVLGCGNIAGIIASRGETVAQIVACHDKQSDRSERYAQRTGARHYPDIVTFLEADFPLLVEAASVAAVRDHLNDALSRAKDVVVLSVGALALAAGMEPEVEIRADPEVSSNQHQIEAQGEFGKVAITTDNVPSPDNPATSYLAALSVLILLRDLADPVRVGT
jgi:predicted dinucleotide-utilizing enzyme